MKRCCKTKVVVDVYSQDIWGDRLDLSFYTSGSDLQNERCFFVKDVTLLLWVRLRTVADDYEYCAQKIQKELNTPCNVQQLASILSDLHARCKNLREDVGEFSIEVTDYWKIGDVMSVYIVIRDASLCVVHETVLILTHEHFCYRVARAAAARTQIDCSYFVDAFKRIRDRCERLSATYVETQAHNKTRKEVQNDE